jgi:pSer/pThr/pTyr-binding forkhead associated (FHA) protein
MSVDRAPARLVLVRPGREDAVYVLEHGRTVTLGRDAGNTIVLASQFVSKRHALVSWTARGVRMEDQDSSNGLTINGLTVHAAQLSHGDVIQIGDQRLVFEYPGQAQGTETDVPAAAPAPGRKSRRFVMVAVLTVLVMGGMLLAVYLLVVPRAAACEGDVHPLVTVGGTPTCRR